MKKEIKCPVCRRIVKPPLEWWKSVGACSDCVRKAALEIRSKQAEDSANEHKVNDYLYEKMGKARGKIKIIKV